MRNERTTLHQVANEAGVSIATVSRVFQGTTPTSEAARLKVVAAAKQLGYQRPPTGSTKPSRSFESYGVVVPALGNGYISDLILGCGQAASQHGQSIGVVVAERRHDVTAAVRELAASVDGLVIVGPAVSDAVALALSRKTPVVLVGRRPLPGIDCVRVENQPCAQRLTEHLLTTHRRSHLVFVGDPDELPDVSERYRGFRLAHVAANLALRRPPLRIPLIEAAGVQVAEEILRRRVRVDALVCANDELAISVMSRLQDSRVSVPGDMAVVGWGDGMAARYVRPGLTTVREPVREVGRMAAELLHHRIAGHRSRRAPHTVVPEMVVRGSCGCVVPPRHPDQVTALRR